MGLCIRSIRSVQTLCTAEKHVNIQRISFVNFNENKIFTCVITWHIIVFVQFLLSVAYFDNSYVYSILNHFFISCTLARHFITRALLSAPNFEQAQKILRDTGVGAADGCSINMTFLK